MKEQFLQLLDTISVRGIINDVNVLAKPDEIFCRFLPQNRTMVGQLWFKKSFFTEEVNFIVNDISALVNTLKTFDKPDILFEFRKSGITDSPIAITIKEKRRKSSLLLGIPATFVQPRIPKDQEYLWEYELTQDDIVNLNSSSNVKCEYFYIQRNSKTMNVSFYISDSLKRSSDFTEIEFDGIVDDVFSENDFKFEWKTFVTILNKINKSRVTIKLTEKFMVVSTDNDDFKADFYLIKIK